MPLQAWPFLSRMKKTSALLIFVTLICLLLSSCQTTDAVSATKKEEVSAPVVVRTINEAHFTSFGFEFDLEVTGASQLIVTYPENLSSNLMTDYVAYFARTKLFESADVDSQKNAVLFRFKDKLTDDDVKIFANSFASGSSSFESFLNSNFDSLEAPVYQLEMDGFVLSIKQVGNSELIVDFPGIPSAEVAMAVIQAAAEVSPVPLNGTDIFMSSGNRVLYMIPAVFDADQFRQVVETMKAPVISDDTQVGAPVVTSEPVSVVQIPVIQTNPQAAQTPATKAPESAPAPVVETEQTEQSAGPLSPGLIMLIIVLGVVAVTCVVALLKRRHK